jgi:MFS family permease
MTDADGDSEYNVPLVVGSLIAGVFFGGVGGGVAFPTLPMLGTILGISPFVVGVILSANRFTRLLMNAPAGQIMDTVGTRKPMVFGLLLQGLAPFGYVAGLYADRIPVVGATEVFVVSRIVWGFGSAFVFVGGFSTVIHVTSEGNRGKWIGYFRGGQSLGFPSGLVLGGLVTDFAGYEVAFAVAGASGLLAMVVAAAVLPNLTPSVETPTRLRDVPGLVRADPRIFTIGSVNFTVRFLFAGVLLSTIVLYAETYGIEVGGISSVGASGLFMALSMVFVSATTLASGNLSDAVDNRALVVAPALVIFAAGFGALGFVPTLPVTVLGVACLGIGVGGTNPPLMALLGDLSPEADVGKMGGVYNVFGDLGATAGPLVALPFAAAFGYRTEYFACAAVALVVLVVLVRTLLGERVGDAARATAGDD